MLCWQGQFYNASDAIIDYEYLTRYLAHYDHVKVLVRTKNVDKEPQSLPRLDGEGVTIVPLSDPVSPWHALRSLPGLVREITSSIKTANACYLKMPDSLGSLVGLILLCLRRPYAVEVVADSYEGIRYAKKAYAWMSFLCTSL